MSPCALMPSASPRRPRWSKSNSALTQQKAVRVKATVKVGPHDVPSRVYPGRLRTERRAKYIDFREIDLARKCSTKRGTNYQTERQERTRSA
jgi:hypothetical protein